MRFNFLVLFPAVVLSGCAFLQPSWHWEKTGASAADYDTDLRFCKTQTDQALDGTVTNASVRRIQGCMMQRGWRKVTD